jgi:hypothetical protein
VTLRAACQAARSTTIAIWLGRLRLTDTPAKKDLLGRIIKATLPLLSKLGQAEEPCSAVRVDVGGWRAGAYQQISYGAAAHMPELTGLPLAIGALMLARGEIHRPGVVAPEACVDADRFLAELQRRGVATVEMTGQWPEAVAVGACPSPMTLALFGLAAWMAFRWLRRRRSG